MTDNDRIVELYSRILTGDRQALVDLYADFGDHLKAYAAAKSGRKELTSQFHDAIVVWLERAKRRGDSDHGGETSGDAGSPRDSGPTFSAGLVFVEVAHRAADERRKRHESQKRGAGRKWCSLEHEDAVLISAEADPLRTVELRDLIAMAEAEMTDEERLQARMRAAGYSWQEILPGCSPETVRNRSRAFLRKQDKMRAKYFAPDASNE